MYKLQALLSPSAYKRTKTDFLSETKHHFLRSEGELSKISKERQVTKSLLIDFIDEMVELIQRYDYILGQYESEDADITKPYRKIQRSLMSETAKLQGQVLND